MKIYKKLFKVTSTMDKMKKDSTNPFFKSKYFDINQLIEAVRPALIAEDLLLLQHIENGAVGTRIIDIETGDSVEAFISLPNIDDPQKLGACVTYYRRFTLGSLLGIEAEDDDGNLAAGNKPKVSKAFKKEEKKPWLNEGMPEWDKAEEFVKGGGSPSLLRQKYAVSKPNMDYFYSIAK